MARDIGDGIESRVIIKMGLSDMEIPTKLYVVQLRHFEDPESEIPHIGIGVDAGDEDAIFGIMSLPEAALLTQALGFAIHEIVGLYAESQSDDLALKTLGFTGGPPMQGFIRRTEIPDVEIQFPDPDDDEYRGDDPALD